MLQLLLGLAGKVPGRVLERGVCLLVKIVVFVLDVEQWMSSLASQRHSVVPESLTNQPADCVSWDTSGGVYNIKPLDLELHKLKVSGSLLQSLGPCKHRRSLVHIVSC